MTNSISSTFTNTHVYSLPDWKPQRIELTRRTTWESHNWAPWRYKWITKDYTLLSSPTAHLPVFHLDPSPSTVLQSTFDFKPLWPNKRETTTFEREWIRLLTDSKTALANYFIWSVFAERLSWVLCVVCAYICSTRARAHVMILFWLEHLTGPSSPPSPSLTWVTTQPGRSTSSRCERVCGLTTLSKCADVCRRQGGRITAFNYVFSD